MELKPTSRHKKRRAWLSLNQTRERVDCTNPNSASPPARSPAPALAPRAPPPQRRPQRRRPGASLGAHGCTRSRRGKTARPHISARQGQFDLQLAVLGVVKRQPLSTSPAPPLCCPPTPPRARRCCRWPPATAALRPWRGPRSAAKQNKAKQNSQTAKQNKTKQKQDTAGERLSPAQDLTHQEKSSEESQPAFRLCRAVQRPTRRAVCSCASLSRSHPTRLILVAVERVDAFAAGHVPQLHQPIRAGAQHLRTYCIIGNPGINVILLFPQPKSV